MSTADAFVRVIVESEINTQKQRENTAFGYHSRSTNQPPQNPFYELDEIYAQDDQVVHHNVEQLSSDVVKTQEVGKMKEEMRALESELGTLAEGKSEFLSLVVIKVKCYRRQRHNVNVCPSSMGLLLNMRAL